VAPPRPRRPKRQARLGDHRGDRRPHRTVASRRHPRGNQPWRLHGLPGRLRQTPLRQEGRPAALPRHHKWRHLRRAVRLRPENRPTAPPSESVHRSAGDLGVPQGLRLRVFFRRAQPSDVPLRGSGLLRPGQRRRNLQLRGHPSRLLRQRHRRRRPGARPPSRCRVHLLLQLPHHRRHRAGRAQGPVGHLLRPPAEHPGAARRFQPRRPG